MKMVRRDLTNDFLHLYLCQTDKCSVFRMAAHRANNRKKHISIVRNA